MNDNQYTKQRIRKCAKMQTKFTLECPVESRRTSESSDHVVPREMAFMPKTPKTTSHSTPWQSADSPQVASPTHGARARRRRARSSTGKCMDRSQILALMACFGCYDQSACVCKLRVSDDELCRRLRWLSVMLATRPACLS